MLFVVLASVLLEPSKNAMAIEQEVRILLLAAPMKHEANSLHFKRSDLCEAQALISECTNCTSRAGSRHCSYCSAGLHRHLTDQPAGLSMDETNKTSISYHECETPSAFLPTWDLLTYKFGHEYCNPGTVKDCRSGTEDWRSGTEVWRTGVVGRGVRGDEKATGTAID